MHDPANILEQLKRANYHYRNDNKYKKYVVALERQLKKKGLSLDTRLVDVMIKGNHLSYNKETNEQSNIFSMLIERYHNEIRSFDDVGLYFKNTIDNIEKRFFDLTYNVTQEASFTNDLSKWPRQAIGFFVNNADRDITLEQVIFTLILLDTVEEDKMPLVNSYSVDNALHELSFGVAHSMLAQYLKNMTNQTEERIATIKRFELNKSDEHYQDLFLYVPEYTYKHESYKLAWLIELGVVELILRRTNNDRNLASKIIHTFIGTNSVAILRGINAYLSYAPDKNNPLNKTRTFLNDMKIKFGIK